MKALGILGTGRMAVRLAKAFAEAGRRVVLGSRDLHRSQRIVMQLGFSEIAAGEYDDAARQDAVLPAIFHRDGLLDTLEPLREQLDGKLFIDITNPFNADYSDFIYPWSTSAAEEIQKRFPRARVVGAFKNVWWEVFDKPLFDGKPSDVFVTGDDVDAKAEFMQLSQGLPFRFLDAGRLVNSRTVERMTLLSGELGQRYGYFPRMNYRLLGEPWMPGSEDRVGDIIKAA